MEGEKEKLTDKKPLPASQAVDSLQLQEPCRRKRSHRRSEIVTTVKHGRSLG